MVMLQRQRLLDAADVITIDVRDDDEFEPPDAQVLALGERRPQGLGVCLAQSGIDQHGSLRRSPGDEQAISEP